MDLVTIAMLIVGLLLIVVYFVSLKMMEGVTFKGDTSEDKEKARSMYSNSMSIILALGAIMFTLAMVMLYKPDSISVPKARIMHIAMVAVALSVLVLASVAIDQIDKGADDKSKALSTYLGVALLPASVAAVILGSLVAYKPDVLKIGSSSMGKFGFDFEF